IPLWRASTMRTWIWLRPTTTTGRTSQRARHWPIWTQIWNSTRPGHGPDERSNNMRVDIYRGQDIAETFRRKALRHAPEGTSAEVKVAMTDTANAVHADVEYVNQTVERDGTLY